MMRKVRPVRRRLKGVTWADHAHASPPRAATGARIYAIGDIHGRADLLQELFRRIDEDLNTYPTPFSTHVLLGDYIDRGPNSRMVVDTIIERSLLHNLVCLKGNHEKLMMDFLQQPEVLDVWQHLGGLETLLSYGLRPSIRITAKARLAKEFEKKLPDRHKEFFKELVPCWTFGDYFFTHAGVKPGTPLANQKEQDLMWIREEFLSSNEIFDKIIVHGHSPVPEPTVYENRINIDTGAYATGILSCLIIDDGGLFLLEPR